MKKSCHNKQVVIMCGISGSGKTAYARRLEKEGYIRLSSDSLIWQKVGADLFRLTKEEQRKLFAESRSEIISKLKELLPSGKKVVVDATHCKRAGRDAIRNICNKFSVAPVFLYCQAEKEELWRRLSQRKGEGPDDLLVSREELDDYWEGFERPQQDERDFFEVGKTKYSF